MRARKRPAVLAGPALVLAEVMLAVPGTTASLDSALVGFLTTPLQSENSLLHDTVEVVYAHAAERAEYLLELPKIRCAHGEHESCECVGFHGVVQCVRV